MGSSPFGQLPSATLEPLCRYVDFRRRLEVATAELQGRLSRLPRDQWRIEPYPLTGERRNTLALLGETGGLRHQRHLRAGPLGRRDLRPQAGAKDPLAAPRIWRSAASGDIRSAECQPLPVAARGSSARGNLGKGPQLQVTRASRSRNMGCELPLEFGPPHGVSVR